MKAIFKFSVLFLTLILTFQCRLEERNLDNEFGYFMSFKADGDFVEYSGPQIGLVTSSHLENEGGLYFQLGSQKNGLSSDKDAFGFAFLQEDVDLLIDHPYIFNYEKIIGSQPVEVGSDNWRKLSLHHAAVYVDGQGVEFSAVPVANHSLQVATEYTVTFTAINPDFVEGTLTAKLYNDELDRYIILTEGKFRLPRVSQ